MQRNCGPFASPFGPFQSFFRPLISVNEIQTADYQRFEKVAKFAGEDLKTITEAIRKAADAVECLIQEGPDKAMNRFNG